MKIKKTLNHIQTEFTEGREHCGPFVAGGTNMRERVEFEIMIGESFSFTKRC